MSTPKKPPSGMGLDKKKPSVPLFKTPTPLKETPPNPTLPIKELENLTLEGKTYKFSASDLEDLGVLGTGNYGTVSKMRFTPTKQLMAMKRIALRELRISDKNEITELAVQTLSRTCPYIVDFYGCLVREGELWMCMELMDTSMEHIFKKIYKVLKQSIPEEIIGKVVVAVVNALHYLQKDLKIIHRDVKPSNILLNENGDIKLCDFGISGRLVDSIAKTQDVGCRPYMAPERIDPKKAGEGYTVKADVWSFGITVMELALGEFPYKKWSNIFEQLNAVVNGEPPRLSRDKFSKELCDFVASCLTKDTIMRPSYDQLLMSEFVVKHTESTYDVAGWYRQLLQTK